MPRRSGDSAIEVVIAENETRMRYLVRNRKFRKDLVGVRSKFHELETNKKQAGKKQTWKTPAFYKNFLKKWGLIWLPRELVKSSTDPKDLPSHAKDYDRILCDALKDALKDVWPMGQIPTFFEYPVSAWDPHEDQLETYRIQYNMWRDGLALDNSEPVRPPPWVKPGTTVVMKIDLGYPQDVLEEFIRTFLGRAIRERNASIRKGNLPGFRQRRRHDKANFYLDVFDRHEARDPYSLIARTLKKRKSTIQYAYMSARLNIGGRDVTRASRLRDGKGETYASPMDRFDLKKHLAECSLCKVAESWHQQCQLCKDYGTYSDTTRPTFVDIQ